MRSILILIAILAPLSLHAACPSLGGEYLNCSSTGPMASEQQISKVTQTSNPTESFVFESLNPNGGNPLQQEFIADGVTRKYQETAEGGSTYNVNVTARCKDNKLIVDIALPNGNLGSETISFVASEKGLIKQNVMFNKVMSTMECERR